jgi:hypothetical protein
MRLPIVKRDRIGKLPLTIPVLKLNLQRWPSA